MDYDVLLTLKRIEERKGLGFWNLYMELNTYKDESSKNTLIICRSQKSAKEALDTFIGNGNNLGEVKVSTSKMCVQINDATIYFIPFSKISEIGGMRGFRIKEYYLEEDFQRRI